MGQIGRRRKVGAPARYRESSPDDKRGETESQENLNHFENQHLSKENEKEDENMDKGGLPVKKMKTGTVKEQNKNKTSSALSEAGSSQEKEAQNNGVDLEADQDDIGIMD